MIIAPGSRHPGRISDIFLERLACEGTKCVQMCRRNVNAISYNRKMMHLLHSDQDLDGPREKGCWDPGGSQACSGKKAGRCWCGILRPGMGQLRLRKLRVDGKLSDL